MADSRLRHSGHRATRQPLMTRYWQDWINYFLGLWVFGSPWFIEHTMIGTQPGAGSRGMINLWVVGLAVVLLTPSRSTASSTGLGGAGSPGAWRVIAALALDHRFQRHGAIDVEFGDLRRASLCLCGLELCGRTAP